MERPYWAPEGVDVEQPSAARVYDYCLGGSHNFPVDRAIAEEATRAMPEFPRVLRENRAFLRRAVRHLVGEGIDQLLDIGSGIPTVGNVHEVAQRANPHAIVVYVDIDPVAVAHSQEILAGNDRVAVVQADLRRPEEILADAQTRRLLDLSRPLGLLIVGMLHFLPDSDNPVGIVRRLGEKLASGSYLALSHASYDQPEGADVYNLASQTSTPMYFRSWQQIKELFDGFELIEPGLVHFPLWRPDSPADIGEHPERLAAFAGVGRK